MKEGEKKMKDIKWKVARKITKEEHELVNQVEKIFRERIKGILAREKLFNKHFPDVACPNEWLVEKKSSDDIK